MMLKRMRNRLENLDSERQNRQRDFAELGFHYQVKEIHLGFEGNLEEIRGNLQIVLSYTVRDGIFLNIKRTKPWQVLFEYSDGAHFTNCTSADEFAQMIRSLESLRQRNHQDHDCDIYAQLERIVLEYLSEHGGEMSQTEE